MTVSIAALLQNGLLLDTGAQQEHVKTVTRHHYEDTQRDGTYSPDAQSGRELQDVNDAMTQETYLRLNTWFLVDYRFLN